VLARPITLEALCDLILDRAFAHLSPEEGALFLRRPSGELYRAQSRRAPGAEGEFVYSRRLIREVAEEGKAALVEDVSRDERFKSSESLLSFGVRSLVAAPLLDAEGSAGMIVLHSRAQVRKFKEEDLELLVSLASAATLRLRTIVLAEEAARRRLLDKELALANEIQMGMLPKRFPDRPEFEIRAALKPARSVGGDLYDFLLAGDRLWFLVGDVSGKGVGAALFMAVTRTLFHAVVPGESALERVLPRMNRELARDNERSMFVTAFLACLDLETGELEYANAGHNPPYRLLDGGALEAVEGGRGVPLGVFEDSPYATDRLALRPGEGLFLYTDGIVEALNAQGEAFTEARLEETLRSLAEAPASRIVDRTLEVLARFVGEAPPSDDVTVMALRFARPA
jgi:serine phosphatase RsbU (regulator of sigma subunit)